MVNVRGTAEYIQAGINLEYNGFFMEGFYQSTFYYAGKANFCPDSDIYGIGGGFKKDHIEIGFKHVCTHPVIPYVYLYRDLTVNQEGAWNEVYIKVQLEGKIGK
jgi:hypothetical protein